MINSEDISIFVVVENKLYIHIIIYNILITEHIDSITKITLNFQLISTFLILLSIIHLHMTLITKKSAAAPKLTVNTKYGIIIHWL